MQFAGEQRVGEFHLYTLPGRSTLLPGLTTSVALFEPAQVKYERSYVVHGDVPFWGFLPQQGEETEPPVEVIYTLKRPRKTDFGDRPLPGGVARLYQPDSAGGLQLVGEASLDHTPAGTDLKLNAGTAFDITAKRVQTSYVTRRDSTKARGRAYRGHRRLSRHPEERHRQRGHGGRAGGAGRRVERGVELGAGGEGVVHRHPFPGAGAGPGGGSADVSNSRDLVTPNPVTIVHLSDLHFGGYADLKQIEALESFLPTLGATALAISGDLSQRARHGEFQAAHALHPSPAGADAGDRRPRQPRHRVVEEPPRPARGAAEVRQVHAGTSAISGRCWRFPVRSSPAR